MIPQTSITYLGKDGKFIIVINKTYCTGVCFGAGAGAGVGALIEILDESLKDYIILTGVTGLKWS